MKCRTAFIYFAAAVISLSSTIPAWTETPAVFPQCGHSRPVAAVAFSPDGHLIISGGEDRKVVVWDIASQRELYAFNLETAAVNSVAFSPDSRTAAAGCTDGTVVVIDMVAGRVVHNVKGRSGTVFSIAFYPDNRYLIASNDRSVTLWDTDSGRVIKEVADAHKGLIFDVAVSSDGRYVASGSWDKTIRIWNARTLQPVRTLQPHNMIYELAFTSDSGRLVSHNLKTAKVWDLGSGESLFTMEGDAEEHFLALSKNGRYLISQKEDDTLSLWQVDTGKRIHNHPGFKWTGRPAAVSYDNQRAVLTGPGFSLLCWDLPTGRKISDLKGYAEDVFSYSFLPSRNLAFSGAFINDLHVWRLATGRELKTIRRKLLEEWFGDNSYVNATAMTPDGKTCAAACDATDIRLYNLPDGTETTILKGHKGYVTALAFSSDGTYLLSGDDDGYINYWHVPSAKAVQSFRANKHAVFDIAFSADNRQAVTVEGGYDKCRVQLWDPAVGKERNRFFPHETGQIFSVVFSPDGKTVLTGGEDGTLRLTDLKTGKLIRTFSGHQRSVYAICFSRDGRRILSGGGDQTVRLWDIRSEKPIRTLVGHTSSVTAVAFFKDETFLISGAENGVTRFWDVKSGRQRAMRVGFPDGEWIMITPEGYFDASQNGAAFLNVRVGNSVYGIEQFYSRFFRPEVVALALQGIALPGPEKLTDLVRRQPAPDIDILSPKDQSTTTNDTIRLTIGLTDNGGGIGDVVIYINGSLVANQSRAISVQAKGVAERQQISLAVPVIEGRNDIRAVAFNANNTMESRPDRVTLFSKASSAKPDLHALVIGINEYRNKSITLKYSVPDAKAVADVLKRAASPLFKQVYVTLLTDFETTQKAYVTKTFETIRDRVRPEDVFVFYNASHGNVDVVDGKEQYFLLTSNVLLLSSQHIGKDAVSQQDLIRLIGSIPAQKKWVILDTCYAGKAGKELTAALLTQTRGLTEATAIKVLQRAVGSSVFSASSDTQQALEGYNGHGLFTYALLEGLQGAADLNRDGFIKITELADYVEETVVLTSEKVFHRQQIPTNQVGVNFPIGQVAR